MMPAANYAYTSLSAKDSITLTLEGFGALGLSAFSGSWAMNQIPEAMCTLAVGRNAADGTTLAAIHKFAAKIKTMVKATVTATFSGQYMPDKDWPKKPLVIFEGYYVGFSYQKVNGRIQPVAHLLHWLTDLGFSSCLSAATHPAIAGSLIDAAVFQSKRAAPGAGGGGQAIFLPHMIGHADLNTNLHEDLWGALKQYMCDMSNYTGFYPVGVGDPGLGRCGGKDTLNVLTSNNRATRALARIEGPGGEDCAGDGVTNTDYKYGSKLTFATPLDVESNAIAGYIGSAMVSDMVQHTFWDLLIGVYCPLFGFDLCPAIDRVVIFPSIPGWRGKGGKYWRDISPSDYDYVDETAALPKPLRGVVIHGGFVADTMANAHEAAVGTSAIPAGLFASPAQDENDGAVLYQPPPAWLPQILLAGLNTANGTPDDTVINSATTPGQGSGPKEETPQQLLPDVKTLLDCYARMIFSQNALRGRSGNFSGRLRFDIAPGSHVKIIGSPEKFIGGEDDLAANKYGQVARMTVEIDAEGRRAVTAFQVIGLRNDAENQDDRTSIPDHPFFPGAIGNGGFPLRPEMDLPS